MADGLDASHYAILRVAKAQVGLSDDDYRALLLRFSGQDSAKGLDRKSFTKVMAHFELLGFKSTSAKKDAARRIGMASQAQLRKITALWSVFTDGTGDETSLRHWMEKARAWPWPALASKIRGAEGHCGPVQHGRTKKAEAGLIFFSPVMIDRPAFKF